MKSKIYNIISKCCLWMWGITCFFATTIGMTVIINKIKFLDDILLDQAAFFFSLFSLCYILYLLGKKDENKEN